MNIYKNIFQSVREDSLKAFTSCSLDGLAGTHSSLQAFHVTTTSLFPLFSLLFYLFPCLPSPIYICFVCCTSSVFSPFPVLLVFLSFVSFVCCTFSPFFPSLSSPYLFLVFLRQHTSVSYVVLPLLFSLLSILLVSLFGSSFVSMCTSVYHVVLPLFSPSLYALCFPFLVSLRHHTSLPYVTSPPFSHSLQSSWHHFSLCSPSLPCTYTP